MLSTWMLAAVAALTGSAQHADNWHADYGKALAETKQDNQPLLVVLDVPGDEAKRLDPSLLSAESGAFPLDSYALCHIDATTEYGKKVAAGFKVTEFPHVAIIDKSGSVILQRVSGDVTVAEWTKALKSHADGLRASAKRVTVAKPVVSSPAVVTPSTGAVSYPSYSSPQPYCPSCQLRNR